jgi:hypothetical protein
MLRSHDRVTVEPMDRKRSEMTAPSSLPGLTRRQKQLIVLGRLAEPDAACFSDRALARQLGVSQPFVSAQRRLITGVAGRPGTTNEPNDQLETLTTTSGGDQDPVHVTPHLIATAPLKTTSAQEALNRFHDQHSGMGRVRRVGWSASDEGRQRAPDWNPFE